MWVVELWCGMDLGCSLQLLTGAQVPNVNRDLEDIMS